MKRSISINILCFIHIVQKFIGLRIQCPTLIIGIVKVCIGFLAYSSFLLSVFPDSCPDLPRLLSTSPAIHPSFIAHPHDLQISTLSLLSSFHVIHSSCLRRTLSDDSSVLLWFYLYVLQRVL